VPLNPAEIRRKRQKLGLSQTEAARRAGFSLQRWHNIESGIRPGIDPDAFYAVAQVLECRMEDLMTRQARVPAKKTPGQNGRRR
jgi:transcriptional regulator with XRE-family HTH domain